MSDSQNSSNHVLDINGQTVALQVRRNGRARRMILRIDDKTGGVVVTIPKRAAVRDGVHMAERKSGWILAQLQRRGEPLMFVDGLELPLLGETLKVRHDPNIRSSHRANGEIIVAGRLEHLPRRLTDWLKAQARTELSDRAYEKAERLNRTISRLTVRDTRSRWGSCGIGGQLNFSWRLVMAPKFVLDYVVAHEVAHLVHHNHGADFWALTQSLTGQMGEAKVWLKAHGRDLHRYGA